MQANESEKDAVWATINTPLTLQELEAFCQDIERLFRINPMLIFKQWTSLGSNCYRFSGQNISQEKPFDFDLRLTVRHVPNGIQIDYQGSLKTSTTFVFESTPNNDLCQSKLTITDSYDGTPEADRRQQLHLVDKSITVWATYLQQYLQSWKKWSHIRLWRWYMQIIWQPMKPSGRRISYILLWMAVFELFLILLGAPIYFME